MFSDDFQGGSLDSSKWTTCYPWAKGSGCTNYGNNELEWYLPSRVSVHDGTLRLTAQKRSVTGTDAHGGRRQYPYRSGMVTTAGHFSFTYGHVEFRARAPEGRGLWPTLWLLPVDESWPPEVDIMEAHGEDVTRMTASYHRTESDARRRVVQVGNYAEDWHTYAVDWRPNSLVWYVDQQQVFAVYGDVPKKPMYLLANLAVDGDEDHAPDGTTPNTASLDIDQVRVTGNR
jgi:beta-glucanase (GH16 family)